MKRFNEVSQVFDLVSIGDSTIDTFIKIHDASLDCDVNHKECKICIPYGTKIPVDTIAYGVAGNAANVAVGCAKLGLRTAIYTNLGDDNQGKTIADSLVSQKVSGDYIKINAGKKSNLSVVLTFQGERTIFVYHQDWYYQLPSLSACSWVYLTSMGESFTSSNIMDEVCHYVEKVGAKLAFSPGTYQLKADVKRYPKILEKCELLIINRDEAEIILGKEATEENQMGDLLSKLLLLGPKIVVITDGAEGSFASDGQKNLKVGVFPTKLVEKTGAGDAYAAALLTGLFFDLPLEEAMVWGTINAAHEIQEVGAGRGILTRSELERHQKSSPQLRAVTF